MRWIYLSPHFDDAVLSCGGWIWEQARQGIPVEVWTVCAGDPPPGPLSAVAQHCHHVWCTGTAEETVSLRRAEDQAANRAIRAAWRHLSLPDCIYRRSPQGEPLYPEEVSAPPHALESALDHKIAAEIEQELHPQDHLACPLAIGGHVDHLLTRAAVEQLGRPIWYYADIPYLFRHPQALAPAVEDLRAALQPISIEGLQAWLTGIAAHASQIGMLFTNQAEMQAAVRHYWEGQGGIQMWGAG